MKRRRPLLCPHPQVWLQQGHEEKAASILAGGRYYYYFGDGWGASVSVREVATSEAGKIERKSAGFCGYDWMIDSIIRHGEILVNPRAA